MEKIKIVVDRKSMQTRVYGTNGDEIKGITHVEFSQWAGELPKLYIGMIPKHIEIEHEFKAIEDDEH